MKKVIALVVLMLCVSSSLYGEEKKAYFSPNRENENVVVQFILGAKKSLKIASYSLTNKRIGEAISKQSNKTQLLCDKQQSQIKSALCTELGGRIDKKSGLMHNKYIVRDKECVLTGSFNFTNNAVYPNRENFVIICDKKLAKQYEQDFNKLWENNT